MRRNVQVFYVLEEDFDSCGVLVVSVASEQELPHADRISPKLETSVALETVCNSVGCHVAIIDQWAATSGHSVGRPPGEVGRWFGVAGAADGLSPAGFPLGACDPPRLGVNLPSGPLSNRACGSPAHGFPTPFIVRHAQSPNTGLSQ
jgi:hypothetical protein